MRKIYCKEKLNKASRKKFLFDYFNKCSPSTFSDPECTVLQCLPRKSRSIGDLKMLLDGSFKTETPEDHLITMLLDLISLKDDKHVVRCLYCSNINKLVFYSSEVHRTYWEYSIDDSNYNKWNDATKKSPIDEYCWNDLVEIYKNKTK